MKNISIKPKEPRRLIIKSYSSSKQDGKSSASSTNKKNSRSSLLKNLKISSHFAKSIPMKELISRDTNSKKLCLNSPQITLRTKTEKLMELQKNAELEEYIKTLLGIENDNGARRNFKEMMMEMVLSQDKFRGTLVKFMQIYGKIEAAPQKNGLRAYKTLHQFNTRASLKPNPYRIQRTLSVFILPIINDKNSEHVTFEQIILQGENKLLKINEQIAFKQSYIATLDCKILEEEVKFTRKMHIIKEVEAKVKIISADLEKFKKKEDELLCFSLKKDQYYGKALQNSRDQQQKLACFNKTAVFNDMDHERSNLPYIGEEFMKELNILLGAFRNRQSSSVKVADTEHRLEIFLKKIIHIYQSLAKSLMKYNEERQQYIRKFELQLEKYFKNCQERKVVAKNFMRQFGSLEVRILDVIQKFQREKEDMPIQNMPPDTGSQNRQPEPKRVRKMERSLSKFQQKKRGGRKQAKCLTVKLPLKPMEDEPSNTYYFDAFPQFGEKQKEKENDKEKEKEKQKSRVKLTLLQRLHPYISQIEEIYMMSLQFI